MGFLQCSICSTLRRLALLLLVAVLLLQASCTPSAWDKAGDDAERDITTGIIVAVVFIGLVVLAVSEAGIDQALPADEWDCAVANNVGLSFEMFVDGQSVGLIEPGSTLEVALLGGWHELRWYPCGELGEGHYVSQVLEVGGEPGRYELTLQPDPGR